MPQIAVDHDMDHGHYVRERKIADADVKGENPAVASAKVYQGVEVGSVVKQWWRVRKKHLADTIAS